MVDVVADAAGDVIAGVAPDGTRSSISALGFRRIVLVCLIVDEQGTTAEVVGVTHRLPRTIRVPLRIAQALIEAGVPRRVETCHGMRRSSERAR